jgi:hypothetical protein
MRNQLHPASDFPESNSLWSAILAAGVTLAPKSEGGTDEDESDDLEDEDDDEDFDDEDEDADEDTDEAEETDEPA